MSDIVLVRYKNVKKTLLLVGQLVGILLKETPLTRIKRSFFPHLFHQYIQNLKVEIDSTV